MVGFMRKRVVPDIVRIKVCYFIFPFFFSECVMILGAFF